MDSFKRVVHNMLSRYGGTATVVVSTQGTYDVNASQYTTVQTSYPVMAVAFDLVLKNNGSKDMTDTLIQEGDKQIFIQPISNSNPLPELNPATDVVTMGGKSWKIVTIKDLNPTLADSVLLELFVRKL